MMYSVAKPFRLDQGDVSFDAPDTVKAAMARAIADNHTHYLQTNGLPRLRELLAAKLRDKNRHSGRRLRAGAGHQRRHPRPVHAVPGAARAGRRGASSPIRSGRRRRATILAAQACRSACPLHEALGWRYDLDELESKITPKTRVLYLNSPNNPTGGVLTRADLERIAAIAQAHDLWVISDEAYEDVVFEGEHISIASLPGMYERTIPLYTFSKSYAMTGLRLGYVAIKDATMRERAKKVLFYTREQHRVGRAVRRHRRARRIRSSASRSSARSCARGAICSIAASAKLQAASSPASRRPARSTRS